MYEALFSIQSSFFSDTDQGCGLLVGDIFISGLIFVSRALIGKNPDSGSRAEEIAKFNDLLPHELESLLTINEKIRTGTKN